MLLYTSFFSKRAGAAPPYTGPKIVVGSITSPGATGNQSYNLGFRPKVILLNTIGSNAAQINDGIFGIGAAMSGTERWTVAHTTRDNSAVSDTYGLLKTDNALSISNTSGTLINICDLVAMTGNGFTLNWQTASTVTIHYIAFHEDCNAKVGSFNLNNSPGIQSITGVGFTPKFLLLATAVQNTTEGVANDLAACIGVATSPTDRFANSIKDTDNLGTSDCAQRLTDQSVFAMISTSAVTAAADLDAFNSDGFDLDITTAPGSQIKVCYLAIGGADFSAKADTIVNKTTTGTQGYTGFGFQPDALMIAGSFVATLGAVTTQYRTEVGLTDGTNHAVINQASNDNAGTSNANSRQSTTEVVLSRNFNDIIEFAATLTSLDADGMTLNWTTTTGSPFNIGAVALKLD